MKEIKGIWNEERRKNEKGEDVDLTQRMSTYQKSNTYKTNT